MIITTISKNITKGEELVIITRQEYEKFLDVFKIFKKRKQINEKNILHWSCEAKKLKKKNKLPVLHSLKNFR
ncbi:MAG: hypothetical protein ABH808_03790 [Candidatus Kuenenbacteria bacterium]